MRRQTLFNAITKLSSYQNFVTNASSRRQRCKGRRTNQKHGTQRLQCQAQCSSKRMQDQQRRPDPDPLPRTRRLHCTNQYQFQRLISLTPFSRKDRIKSYCFHVVLFDVYDDTYDTRFTRKEAICSQIDRGHPQYPVTTATTPVPIVTTSCDAPRMVSLSDDR